jgi:hypothetical protein
MPNHMHINDSLTPKKPMTRSFLLFTLFITTDLRLAADSTNRDLIVEPEMDDR